MENCVMDASVLIASLRKENPSIYNRFLELLQKQSLGKLKIFIPNLAFYEIANGLRFSISDQKMFEEIYRNFINWPIKTFNVTPDLIVEATEVAYKIKTTVYDAIYHVLAKYLDGIFYTCDLKYYQTAKKIGNIELLD